LFSKVFISFICPLHIHLFLMNDSENFIIKIYLKHICGCAVFSTIRILLYLVIHINEGLLCLIKVFIPNQM
jgi:hypothetical protein